VVRRVRRAASPCSRCWSRSSSPSSACSVSSASRPWRTRPSSSRTSGAQALILLNDIVERINANRGSATCYAITNAATGTPYLGTITGGGYAGTPNCTAGYVNTQTKALADSGMYEWDQILQGAAEVGSGGNIGAMAGARGCVSYDAWANVYTVAVAWQGMTDTFTPVVNCGNGLYGPETKRRVVWTTLQIAKLS